MGTKNQEEYVMITNDDKHDELASQLQLFMETINDLIIVVDHVEDFKMEYVNKCLLLEKLGYSQKGILGRVFAQIIHSDDIKKAAKIIRKGSESGEKPQEIKLLSVKGESIWAEIKVKTFTIGEKTKKSLVILKDISKIKKLEEDLKENEERFKKITETIPEIRFWKLFNPKKYEEALQSSYEMLQIVMESIPQYIIWKDLDLSYLGCNENYAKLINIEHSENIINKTDNELLWDKDRIESNQKKEKSVIKSNKPEFHSIESWILRNGEKIWIDVNRIPLNDSDGNVVGVLITFEDITERKKATEDLIRQHDRLERIMETNPAGILSVDREGYIIYANSQAEKVLQFPKEKLFQLTLKTDQFIILDIDGKYISEDKLPFQVIMATKQPLFDYRAKMILPSKKEILISINGTPLISSEGDVENIIFTVEDITERELSELKIKESQEKYRDLLETSTVGILELDLENNNVSYINPKLLDIMGYNEIKKVNEKLMEEIIHPDDLQKVFHSEEDRDLEFRIVTKEGKIKWLHGRRLNQYDDKGEIIRFRLWLEDTTEKKLYEELIYELNINFLNFTTDIQQNIEMLLKTCLKLLNGEVILYVNKHVHDGKEYYRVMTEKGDIKGFSSEEVEGKLFISELFRENHDFTQEFFDIDKTKYMKTDGYLTNNDIKACYGKLILSGNELNDLVCVFFKENPIITNQNKLVLFLICDAIEIEERRWEAQQHLEEQNKMLSEINKLKSDLFSRTSHELKTPLISIKGFTELLLKLHSSKFDSDVISILEEIKNGSKRLENYVNTIVESSQLEQGLLKLKNSKENLTFLINYCVKELKGMAEFREQTIIVNVDADLYTVFDKERIYEVVSNLLLNAIKYTPIGGTITIDYQKERNSYTISISDTGIGLTKQERKQLFTQFGKIERYGQGFDVGIEGTGLGLYISKEIMELHKGKIWAESEGRNKGSTFYFSLPIIEK